MARVRASKELWRGRARCGRGTGYLRMAAGPIPDRLELTCSPEVSVARGAFRNAGEDVVDLIRGSISGRELVDAGFSGDVELAIETDVCTTTPALIDGAYRPV